MPQTVVTLKDGRRFSGPIWKWLPREGYLELVDEDEVNDGEPIRIAFGDVAEASTLDASGARDELARARSEGWSEPS